MIDRVRLQHIRSWTAGEIRFSGGPQILWGANGAGKTTAIEALVVAATGRSHRASALRELVQEGAANGAFTVTLRDPQEAQDDPLATTTLAAEIGRSERTRYLVNGTARRSETLGEKLKVATFVPEETGLVVGAPSIRRAVLDRMAIQWKTGYRAALTRYERTLKQRNRLLKDALESDGAERRAISAEMKPWTELLISCGAEIVAARNELLRALAAPLSAAHREVAPTEGALAVHYVSREAHLQDEDEGAAATRLRRAFEETAESEGYQGHTLVGPHRDDLMFTTDGKDLAPIASRGQQRSLLLALLFAEIELLTTERGEAPLLLLDDAFSELDPERRDHLVQRLTALP
ncbi:MAG: DNA replication/repair protein RecF, partial [Candidatus Limnocylindrus sp.]